MPEPGKRFTASPRSVVAPEVTVMPAPLVTLAPFSSTIGSAVHCGNVWPSITTGSVIGGSAVASGIVTTPWLNMLA
jgi:hypothetical protein